ncbi:hypothetical protein LguiB_005021 [Lonicera macranthoides]
MRVGPKRRRWGTWEELILGGAVLRHGTQDWNVVASELRTRTVSPYGFTPEDCTQLQACKAKYEALQRRYSGCTAWFEELRKRRVAELKRELEKSEDSIGSLESKLESLKAEKGIYIHVDYDSSQTESPVHLPKTEVTESSVKETSKDGLSAGSFTLDSCTNWSTGNQIPVAVSPETGAKPEVSENCEPNKALSIKNLSETCVVQGGTLRKRRGKRKRKGCSREVKEGSIGESDNLDSANAITASLSKETSTSECGQTVRSSSIDGQTNDLIGIFNSVAENKHALCFRRRLDSQKRARYKKIIRQHMDFDTIRSRIANYSIKSSKELFRDLLLLANNALVFYSRRTREYKSALSLRDLVTKAYQQHSKESGNRASSSLFCLSPMCSPPVRPRSVRPRPCKRNPLTNLRDSDTAYKNQSNGESSTLSQLSLEMAKKGGTTLSKKLSNGDSGTLSIQSLLMTKRSTGIPIPYKKLSNGDLRNFPLQSLIMAKKSGGIREEWEKTQIGDSNLPLVMAKRGFGQTGKVGRGTANQQAKTPVTKERKRARQRS